MIIIPIPTPIQAASTAIACINPAIGTMPVLLIKAIVVAALFGLIAGAWINRRDGIGLAVAGAVFGLLAGVMTVVIAAILGAGIIFLFTA